MAIVVLKVFGDDDAGRIQDERARVRNAEGRTRLFDRVVQDAQTANGLRIGVREQGEVDALALGEGVQDGFAIVADPGQAQAELAKLVFVLFQLDELGFAVGSPIG